MQSLDVIIIGAGASGLMCGIQAGKRKKQVLIIESKNTSCNKIKISGGGSCNFTNYNIYPHCYISHNPHFCKSALSRYTQYDFINFLKQHKIPYLEKESGKLFCKNRSTDIINALLNECNKYNVKINLNTKIKNVKKIDDNKYKVITNNGIFVCKSLVIASGGLSIPSIGASSIGYNIANQFNIKVWPTKPGLVPLSFNEKDHKQYLELSGISIDSLVKIKNIEFQGNILFTHKGLSGPAILQISSYWDTKDTITINFFPKQNICEILMDAKNNKQKKLVKSLLFSYFPKRFVEKIIPTEIAQKKCLSLTNKDIELIEKIIHFWNFSPSKTEGFKTAEVTVGGVDCNAISSKTMESNTNKGLFFIGEVLDVTGWLGGYNLQWAWSSGYCAGLAV